MDDYIHESGIDFIKDDAFWIEKSAAYSTLENVRSVEFVRVKENKLMFVEAKTTLADPNNPNSMIKYNAEIADICDKFVHSLNLLSSIALRVKREELPQAFKGETPLDITFVMVIKNHKIEWCRGIPAKIMQMLPMYIRAIWRPVVIVANQESAIKQGIAAERTEEKA